MTSSTCSTPLNACGFAAPSVDAAGRALSPFHLGGAQRWFAEPPHMQVSLVRVPRGVDAAQDAVELAGRSGLRIVQDVRKMAMNDIDGGPGADLKG